MLESRPRFEGSCFAVLVSRLSFSAGSYFILISALKKCACKKSWDSRNPTTEIPSQIDAARLCHLSIILWMSVSRRQNSCNEKPFILTLKSTYSLVQCHTSVCSSLKCDWRQSYVRVYHLESTYGCRRSRRRIRLRATHLLYITWPLRLKGNIHWGDIGASLFTAPLAIFLLHHTFKIPLPYQRYLSRRSSAITFQQEDITHTDARFSFFFF